MVNISGGFLHQYWGKLLVAVGISKWFLYQSHDKYGAQPSPPDSGLRQHSSLPW